MKTLPEAYRTPLIGAAVAVTAGLLLGAGLKAEIAPTSSYGAQLLVSNPTDRARSAFDDWYPAESAPPPVYHMAALREDDGMMAGDIDRQIARLMDQRQAEFQSMSYEPEPEPAPAARRDPQPYLPSSQGDILASARYEPPPADAPRWGWALPGEATAVPPGAPPQIYEDGAAG